MSRVFVAAFGVVMFALGALVVPAAQEPRRMPDGLWDEATYIPHVPQVGEIVSFGTGGTCTLQPLRRQWVRCSASPEWRNLYNGNSYTVYSGQ